MPATGLPRGEDVIPSRDAEARPSLSGHAIGNLLLAALVELEHGDFEEAVREMNRVLAVRGRVVPATATPLTLHARLDDGTEVAGQSRIAKTNRVDRVWVAPDDVRPTDDAQHAIAEAEVIVLGPGVAVHQHPARAARARDPRRDRRHPARSSCSRATSRRSPARPAASTSPTTSTSSSGTALGELPDVVLGNNRFNAAPPAGWLGETVRLRWPPVGANPPRLILDDLVDPANAHHHDPERLATAVMGAWERESRIRRRPALARAGRSA